MKWLLRLVVAVAVIGLVGIGVLVANSQGWILIPGLTHTEAPTYGSGGPQALPGATASSWGLIVRNPQGQILVNTQLDPAPLVQNSDRQVVPGEYPGFYSQPGQTVLPCQGQPGTVTIVGHSGVTGTREVFTALMALENSWDGATASLHTPCGDYDLVANGGVPINKFDLGSDPKLLLPVPGRVEVVACEIGSNGQLTGRTLVLTFKNRVPGQSPTG